MRYLPWDLVPSSCKHAERRAKMSRTGAAATRWSDLNYVRLAILAMAWLASLKALSAFSEPRR